MFFVWGATKRKTSEKNGEGEKYVKVAHRADVDFELEGTNRFISFSAKEQKKCHK